MLDCTMIGSSLSLRSFGRMGSSFSVYGITHLGSSFSVMDFVCLGSALSLRSFARLGSAVSVFGMSWKALALIRSYIFSEEVQKHVWYMDGRCATENL